jgi:hypothetical protein
MEYGVTFGTLITGKRKYDILIIKTPGQLSAQRRHI